MYSREPWQTKGVRGAYGGKALGGAARVGARLMAALAWTLRGDVATVLADAVRAEELGYDALWFADTGYPDALSLAGTVLERTRRIEVGIAVVPVYTRTPAVLASSAATLGQLGGGRFLMGLGSSSHTIVESWHGLPLEHPVARVRETTELMRHILKGEKTAYAGDTVHSHGYRLGAAVEVPIYLAALRPRMLELAGEIGDGVVLNLFPRRALGRIMGHIQRGAQRAGRDLGALPVACRYQLAVTDRAAEQRAWVRRFASVYYCTEVYNRYLAWCGYEEVAARLREAWQARDREGVLAAFPEELVEEIAIIGDADYCRERLLEYEAGGINVHIVAAASDDAAVRAETMLRCASFGAQRRQGTRRREGVS